VDSERVYNKYILPGVVSVCRERVYILLYSFFPKSLEFMGKNQEGRKEVLEWSLGSFS
jgi:hypothetical protein